MDILLADRFRKMIKQSNLRITMSQLVEMTGVSTESNSLLGEEGIH